jgi:hypothetical protein
MTRFVFLIILGLASAVSAQEVKSGKTQFAIIPTGDVVLAVAAQPDCPLRLENPRLLYNIATKRPEYDYDVRNAGKKNITGYITEMWRANGTGGTLSVPKTDKPELILPGTSIRSNEYDLAEFVPYTKEMREQMKIGKETRILILLVVREVWYSDGTKFDASKDVERIRAYFEKLGDAYDN